MRLTVDDYIAASVVVCTVVIGVVVAWRRNALPPSKPSAGGVPTLTIGEHLRRTNAYFVRVAVPLACAWIAAVTLFVPGIPRWEKDALAIGGTVVGFLIGFLLVKNKLRCPRCGVSFEEPWQG